MGSCSRETKLIGHVELENEAEEGTDSRRSGEMYRRREETRERQREAQREGEMCRRGLAMRVAHRSTARLVHTVTVTRVAAVAHSLSSLALGRVTVPDSLYPTVSAYTVDVESVSFCVNVSLCGLYQYGKVEVHWCGDSLTDSHSACTGNGPAESERIVHGHVGTSLAVGSERQRGVDTATSSDSIRD